MIIKLICLIKNIFDFITPSTLNLIFAAISFYFIVVNQGINDEEYLKYKESIVNIINRNNFLSFSKSKIKKFLSVENEQHFLRYRFELLNS